MIDCLREPDLLPLPHHRRPARRRVRGRHSSTPLLRVRPAPRGARPPRCLRAVTGFAQCRRRTGLSRRSRCAWREGSSDRHSGLTGIARRCTPPGDDPRPGDVRRHRCCDTARCRAVTRGRVAARRRASERDRTDLRGVRRRRLVRRKGNQLRSVGRRSRRARQRKKHVPRRDQEVVGVVHVHVDDRGAFPARITSRARCTHDRGAWGRGSRPATRPWVPRSR